MSTASRPHRFKPARAAARAGRSRSDECYALTSGAKPDRHGWLTPVGVAVSPC
ncbi:MAG TPA: hypothetical protein VI699_03190 [Candidatus Acidoferrales bacterium]|nr:hypothetical protein [Candidatus Acidoferrales bacterium]